MKSKKLVISVVFGVLMVLSMLTAMAFAVNAVSQETIYFPSISKPPEYPFNNWVLVPPVWVENSTTYVTLFHADGWRLTAVCIDELLPVPDLYSPCVYLGGGMFNCGYGYQNFQVIVILVTPTPTNTPTPTATATATNTPTATSTELPTETPEPTLHPPTGVTDTPTPEVSP